MVVAPQGHPTAHAVQQLGMEPQILNPKPNLGVVLEPAETPQPHPQLTPAQPNAEPVGETDDLSALLSRASLESYREFSADSHRLRRASEPAPSSTVKPAPADPTDPSPKVDVRRGQRQWNTRYASRWSVLAGLSPDDANQPGLTLAQTLAERLSSPLLLISSLSGGIGKTTTVASIARCLAMYHERVVIAETAESSLLPFHFGADRVGACNLVNFVIPNSSGAVRILNTASMRRPGREDHRPRSDSVQHDPAAALVQAAKTADRLPQKRAWPWWLAAVSSLGRSLRD